MPAILCIMPLFLPKESLIVKFESILKAVAGLVFWWLFAHCAHAGPETERLSVFAANYPLAYFAERIGGDRLAVNFPVPANVDPPYWEPDAETIAQIQKADMIVLNGADYEKWLTHVSLPKLKEVDTSAGFKQAYINIETAVTHSHGPDGMHSHAGIAYTTWLDFDQAAKQAGDLAQALIRRHSDLKPLFLDNLARLQADLKTLDEALLQVGKASENRPILGSHPVYQYLARRYQLNMQSVHWEPNLMPPAGEWTVLQNILTGHPARLMIWEAQPNQDVVARLKAMGITSLVFDPCAQRPASGDFLSVMRANIADLKSAFERLTTGP